MSQAFLPPLPAPPLRVVFLGTPDFAATILDSLLSGPDLVVGVFSRPDAASGRGLTMSAPPTKRLAEKHAVRVAQPRGWKDGSALETLAAMQPDLALVAAYGRLLPQAALDLPRFGWVNVHASLLPRWRGADPISRAILEGDQETGVTIMRMVLEMDAGAILHQKRIPIEPEETAGALEERLARLGAVALHEALDLWREGRLAAREQDAAQVTHAPPVKKEAGRIDWSRDAPAIERATRAFDPWPGATTTWQGSGLRLWRARVEPVAESSAAPGAVLSLDADGPLVATGDRGLRLLEVQAAGKRRMAAADWARGARIRPGARLGE